MRREAASNNRRIVQQGPCALRGLADGPHSWPGRAYVVRRTPLTGIRAPCGRFGAEVAGMPNWTFAPCVLPWLTGTTAGGDGLK